MGALCGGTPQNNAGTTAPTIEAPKKLTLYGNILDNQSRTVKALCSLSQVNVTEIEIDYLNPEALKRFKDRNVAGSIPMIEEG